MQLLLKVSSIIYLLFCTTIENKIEQVLITREYLLYQSDLPEDYIDNRLELAIKLEQQYGVPVEVQFAVDIVESGVIKDNNYKYNNYSWITCNCTYNKKRREQHIKEDKCFSALDVYAGKVYRFRKYSSMEENWIHKVKIIANYSWFKPNREFEFYAFNLQGTYAESKKYTKALLSVRKSYFANFHYDILHITEKA